MRFLLLFMMCLPVALAGDLHPVSGYEGKSVTLPSWADPSWELSSITWSIWDNTTSIATHFGGDTDVNSIHKYHGRLQLNIRTGDLLITNLTIDDQTEYTVDLVNSKRENKINKIQLKVKQRLTRPTIQTTLSPGPESCLWRLRCTSPDAGVELSWKTEPGFQSYTIMSDGLMGVLDRTQSSVEFTCVSSKNGDQANATTSLKCQDPPPPANCSSTQTPPEAEAKVIYRDPVLFVPGFFVGVLVGASFCIFFRNRC